MDRPAETFSLSTVRELFDRRGDPYAGFYLEEPRRIGGVVLVAAGILTFPLAVVSPPTEAIGEAGWAVGAAINAINFVSAYLLLRPGSRVGVDGFLVMTYVGVTQIAVFEWLAGGHSTPYHELYIAPAVLPPSIHPPRRAFPVLGFTTAAIFLPLAYQGGSAGVVADMALQASFIWILALITMAVLNAVRLQRIGLLSKGEQANLLARSDALTGLGNRLAFDEALEREIDRARTSGAPLTLLILDLDRFKHINDTFGHPTGDKTLSAVADAMRNQVRLPDACFRWGGDELALLLPDTARDEAADVGDRLLAAIRSQRILPDETPVSFTFGVAQMRSGEDAAQLMAEADAALVASKRDGAQDGSNSGRT